ncbi:toxic anion resistance protein [Peribacillus kribbensis]|uniref:toxic anion resistance protein n=1 Tax=Peribacillus kribbensis TaxID=356658 RepID=UPI000425B288|nr:toxic anion resistance protein [Peribacillus kribbensis]
MIDQHSLKERISLLDPEDSHSILSYGNSTQTRLAEISGSMLQVVQRKEAGLIGDAIQELLAKLDEVPVDKLIGAPGKFSKLFRRRTSSIQETLSKLHKMAIVIERISVKLDRSKSFLLEDTLKLERYKELNYEFYHDLEAHITAGEKYLEILVGQIIPKCKEEGDSSLNPMKADRLVQGQQCAELLENRLLDLKVSREIALQSIAQINMIQKSNEIFYDKIQSSIVTSIPIWRNQVSIVLSLLREKKAEEIKRWNNSIETAGIQTLKGTQENLMSSLREAIKIHQAGEADRNKTVSQLSGLASHRLGKIT